MATSKKKKKKPAKKSPRRKPPSRKTATPKKARPKTASAKSRTTKRSKASKKAPATATRSKKAPSPKATSARRVAVKADAPKPRGVPIEVLGGKRCDFLSDRFGELDPRDEGIARAIRSFIALRPSALAEVEEHVFRYYLDCKAHLEPGDAGYVEIATAKDVWKHVDFGFEATVGRRKDDGKVYISLECNCDWEPEHGLQLVFKEGCRVNKVGPFDGHVTTSDAYADPSLEDVVYRPRARA